MALRRFASPFRFFLAASIACLSWTAGPAAGFGPILEYPIPVVEYYNIYLHHYFLTTHDDEMAAIATGAAGPGWTRTGWSFSAYRLGAGTFSTTCPGGCGEPVSRFYSAYSNSHFYTTDAAEAAAIQQPGSEWKLERQEFQVPVPDANGQCAAGQVPVYRLYNNRFAFHDSNHRFVTDAGERARMVAQGWIDEGVRFCALGAATVPIKSFLVAPNLGHKILPSATCEDESVNRGPCMALNNLPPPTTLYPPVSGESMPAGFFDKTGMSASYDYVLATPDASISPQHVFVQGVYSGGGQALLGIHIDTRDRGPSQYSSANPLYQFHTTVDPGAFDDRFFPFSEHESDVQLAVHFTLNVKTVETRGAGSAAYGHPTIEFIDQRSGHHLYFTVMTYGTPPAVPAGDYLAPDVATGKVIVGTSFRSGTPYGRSLGLPTLPTPSGFVSPNYWGWGGYFEFRMDKAEFQHVIDSARTIDPALSPSPADYLVDNFHFNNEVYGDGEIGINLDRYTLELLRR